MWCHVKANRNHNNMNYFKDRFFHIFIYCGNQPYALHEIEREKINVAPELDKITRQMTPK